MATLYALVVGAGLLLIGIIGFVRTEFFGLHFNPLHNTIHLLSGAIGVWAGLGGSGDGAKTYAQVFGVTYTLVAIAGFVGVPAFLSTLLKLDCNLQCDPPWGGPARPGVQLWRSEESLKKVVP